MNTHTVQIFVLFLNKAQYGHTSYFHRDRQRGVDGRRWGWGSEGKGSGGKGREGEGMNIDTQKMMMFNS
jgi:hypothetical protein